MTEDDVIRAGELALGVLDGKERAAALRQVIADPAFAREVEQWRSRLAGLHADWPEAEPGKAAERRVTAIPRRGNQSATWRWTTALASIAAGALLVVVLRRPASVPIVQPSVTRAAPSLVAVFDPKGGEPFSAVVNLSTRDVRVSGAVAVPAGRAAELWAIGADGVPHAAGLFPSKAPGPIQLIGSLTIRAGMTLAISIEPTGGSPKPAPTGPVVTTAKVVAI